jgi:4-aminobutyrate aminotransferase-like enzyme
MMERLTAVESRNVTWSDDHWPIFWEEARGANVRDADGNVYVDLTSAFGVSLLGHRSRPLELALGTEPLIHGMGDIHPPVRKLELLERLADVSPWNDARIVLANTGSECVEIALKTGALASGRPGVLAFEGGYHGLTAGSLAVTERPHFRSMFEPRLYAGVAFAAWPDALRADGTPTGTGSEAGLGQVRELLEAGAPNGDAIGTIIVEPVQARGGARVPPAGFMADLSDLAADFDVVIVADEIFTGLGRCGAMFASERVGLRPDVICVGKALGAGLPISACLGPRRVMDAWPESSGEAIHTSTFLGHPLACAAAIGTLDALANDRVCERAESVGAAILKSLGGYLDHESSTVRVSTGGAPTERDSVGDPGPARAGVADVRGLGLLLGVEFVEADGSTSAAGAGLRVAERVLREGLIVLPAGAQGEVLELTPPIVLSDDQIDFAARTIASAIAEVA